MLAFLIACVVFFVSSTPVFADERDKVWEETDLLVEGETPIEFKRMYNKFDFRDMGLGIHFKHNFNISYEDKGDCFRVDMGDGNILFLDKEDASRLNSDNELYKSFKFEDANLIIELADGSVYTFDENKNIQRIDNHGKILNFAYEAYVNLEEGFGGELYRLKEISSKTGKIELKYDESNNLSMLHDNLGRELTYIYDDKYLTSCRKSDGSTLYYRYDESGNLENKSIVKAEVAVAYAEVEDASEEKIDEFELDENSQESSLDSFDEIILDESILDELGEDVTEEFEEDDSEEIQLAYEAENEEKNDAEEDEEKFVRKYGRKADDKKDEEADEEKDFTRKNKQKKEKAYVKDYARKYAVSNENIAGDKDVVLIENNWLALCSRRTFENGGRIVNIPREADPKKWAMKESQSAINFYARGIIGNRNYSKVGSNYELLDKDNRYWVAVGPKVMNPNYYPNGKLLAESMNYGTLLDVELMDEDGDVYYVKAVVGDAKAHTYPNGIFQTGTSFDTPYIHLPYHNDGSIIEFMGDASVHGLNKYKITKIIVYD